MKQFIRYVLCFYGKGGIYDMGATKKKLWYYRPADYKSRGRGKFSMDEIRERHGSEKVKAKERSKIKAA